MQNRKPGACAVYYMHACSCVQQCVQQCVPVRSFALAKTLVGRAALTLVLRHLAFGKGQEHLLQRGLAERVLLNAARALLLLERTKDVRQHQLR